MGYFSEIYDSSSRKTVDDFVKKIKNSFFNKYLKEYYVDPISRSINLLFNLGDKKPQFKIVLHHKELLEIKDSLEHNGILVFFSKSENGIKTEINISGFDSKEKISELRTKSIKQVFTSDHWYDFYNVVRAALSEYIAVVGYYQDDRTFVLRFSLTNIKYGTLIILNDGDYVEIIDSIKEDGLFTISIYRKDGTRLFSCQDTKVSAKVKEVYNESFPDLKDAFVEQIKDPLFNQSKEKSKIETKTKGMKKVFKSDLWCDFNTIIKVTFSEYIAEIEYYSDNRTLFLNFKLPNIRDNTGIILNDGDDVEITDSIKEDGLFTISVRRKDGTRLLSCQDTNKTKTDTLNCRCSVPNFYKYKTEESFANSELDILTDFYTAKSLLEDVRKQWLESDACFGCLLNRNSKIEDIKEKFSKVLTKDALKKAIDDIFNE